MNKLQFTLITLLIAGCYCAHTQNITGQVVVDSLPKENVNIKNLGNDRTAITNEQGLFTIQASAGDVLLFTAVNLETRRRKLDEADFAGKITIKMASKITQLEEVKISQTVTAEQLGIIPKGQKKYTPAESRLYTARSGILDPLLNKISGRTSMLKKEVVAEHNIWLLQRLDGWFDAEFYVKNLYVPEDYINGFKYYLIENPDFVRALSEKNKSLGKFLIRRLAVNYRVLILEPANGEKP